MHDTERHLAQQRLRARRHRDGRLRLRAVLLSLVLFGVFWALVFAQMVSGHDPVLSPKAATARAGAAQRRQANHRRRRQERQRQRAAQQPQLAIDPSTGAIVEVPAANNAPAVPATPPPAPVTTSQS